MKKIIRHFNDIIIVKVENLPQASQKFGKIETLVTSKI